MPEIKVKHVVTSSSEDKGYPADNLLKPEGTSKWRSGAAGEKNVVCVLQLEKATKISQIDIGNEGSAFIEVLVGRSSDSDDDYKVILVASSFMSPSESRTSQNLNRVRIFSEDKLSNAVLNDKWDRVKIVCSQPFNKTVKYGLAFFKLHSPSDGTEPKTEKQTSLGGFRLKADDENGADLKPGSLFASRHKEPTPGTPLSGAAAVRAASRAVETSPKPSSPVVERRKSQDKPQQTAASTSTPPPVKRKHTSSPTEEKASKPKASLHRQSQSTSSINSERSSKDAAPPLKKTRSDPSAERPSKPLGEIMKKVVFVLSGYQNPERGNIRDKALEMGATYKPDWGNSCTHLICAFANTPKYNAVKRKGRIVTKDWISQCYKKGRLLPWRKFRLGNAPSPPGSEIEESDEETAPPVKREKQVKESRREEQRSKSPVASSSKIEDDPDDPAFYEGSTDEEMDTDDEIERVRASSKTQTKAERASPSPAPSTPPVTVKEEDSTGESENEDLMENLPELPDFFKNKHFFFYGDRIPAKEKRILYRYIVAYNGKLEEYMNEDVQFVLSNDTWDDNFDEALSDNPSLAFVKPAWVHACYEKQKFLPHQKYVIVPQ